MAKKPLSEMSDKGYAAGSEWSGYILHELKEFAKSVEKLLAGKASSAEIQTVWRSCEKMFASKSETTKTFSALANKIEGMSDLKSNIATLSAYVEKCALKSELVDAASYIANKIDSMKTYTVDNIVTASEMLALNATPKELLPAPGAGKYLEIIRVELFYDFESAAYAATAGKDVSLEYATSGQLISIAATGVLDQVSDQRRCVNHNATHLVGVNEAIILKMAGGEVTTGDSPLKVRLDYRLVDVLV